MATAMVARGTLLDRAIGYVLPEIALRRIRARVAADMLVRHYEAATPSRRTQGWRRTAGDANAVAGPSLAVLRETARDLVRNNGYAESALSTIADHVVGYGITPKPKSGGKRASDVWREWAETPACDADGQNDIYGLQDLTMQTVAESGEAFIRRRLRRPEDGLPIPLQIQVLEPDYLDTLKTGILLPNGGRIVHGVEFDVLGRRVAYYFFREHPGSETLTSGALESHRVPAESVSHVYRHRRPGQVRGASWFAPVLLRFKDFDEYEDATLMKQKIAACLAVITSDIDGSASPLGAGSPSDNIDSLEPGMLINAPAGRTIQVVQPPSVREYADYVRTSLRAIATGLGVTYEDLTGDYSGMPFSAARMSRLRHWARVEKWRWRMLIPKFCVPVWAWAMQAAAIVGRVPTEDAGAEWTAPPAPMIDPGAEGLAYMRNIRTGIQSLSEALRERGYDPRVVLEEIAEDNKLLDELGLILDSDPRNTTQAGNPRQQAQAAGSGDGGDGGGDPDAEPEPDPDDEDEDEEDESAERARRRGRRRAVPRKPARRS